MFTGIIQEVGIVRHIVRISGGLLIRIEAFSTSASLKVGGSVNINGACQTVVKVSPISKGSGRWFEVLATSETVSRTSFKILQVGDRVNLELPLTLNGPLGGHLVAGHVDDTGKLTIIKPLGESSIMRVAYKAEYNRYLIEKGSVAVDGISLTAFDIEPGAFSVSLIPETIERTNLKFRKIGDMVNLEFDQIGKYVEKFVNRNRKGLTMNFLSKHGFQGQ